ncbi:MAG: DUF5367 family protein [Edaphobacter sp.]|uniref:DUF5367 family protein n=1 Tax=Edaphobacter sp. TaxID=1934404 RepID=UPI0023A1910B|nr:DUF5367 family protein [Edaphobacter sp.]MDE1177993.1 DUF5367 family protein [Edaphobacter sp.]
MKRPDLVLLLAVGVAFWIIGTIYFSLRGRTILEGRPTVYRTAVLLTAALSSMLCIILFRFMNIPSASWATAMLLIALPGMFGEVIALTNPRIFLPRMQPASAGRYAALLFMTYAVALAIGEFVSLSSTLRS